MGITPSLGMGVGLPPPYRLGKAEVGLALFGDTVKHTALIEFLHYRICILKSSELSMRIFHR